MRPVCACRLPCMCARLRACILAAALPPVDPGHPQDAAVPPPARRGQPRQAAQASPLTPSARRPAKRTAQVIAQLPRASARQSAAILSSIEFDREGGVFATAGVSKRISLFEYAAVLAHPTAEQHFPASELITRSKLSCLSWNRCRPRWSRGVKHFQSLLCHILACPEASAAVPPLVLSIYRRRLHLLPLLPCCTGVGAPTRAWSAVAWLTLTPTCPAPQVHPGAPGEQRLRGLRDAVGRAGRRGRVGVGGAREAHLERGLLRRRPRALLLRLGRRLGQGARGGPGARGALGRRRTRWVASESPGGMCKQLVAVPA